MTREKPGIDTLVPVSEPHPIILFDGVCNLCNASVQWIIRRDTRDVFRFAALQSDAGRRVLSQAGGNATLDENLSSMIVIDQGRVLTKSDAAIAIASRLGAPWRWAKVGRVIPRFARDWAYGVVARNRYRVFGKQESCMMPTPALRARFLDAQEQA
ncbi:MAG: thiol-disulfide oxidoreductase DCC family protein [Phycisphaerae bacterium]|jgi:predicted DCC family thiol-disulfide oxidoreductase YuxK